MTTMLNAIEGVSCVEPEGAFYCFPDVSGLLGRSLGGRVSTSSSELAGARSEEHTSELQSLRHLVCRLFLVKQSEVGLSQGQSHAVEAYLPSSHRPEPFSTFFF